MDGEVEKYDFIFANQVFEHLPDPRAALTTLVACLRPGGVVYLRVPDGRDVAAALRANGWQPHLDAVHPLEHINCFTRRSLIDFAGRCGLRAFDPPPRFTRGRLWGSLKREFADRYRTTHVYFRV